MVLKGIGQRAIADTVFVTLLLLSCHAVAQVSAVAISTMVSAKVSSVDSTGMPVTLAQPAKRIITLSPHAAELVAAAGALNAIVAVSEHSDAPDRVKSLPVIGNASALDYERIAALQPDLIVAPSYLQPAQRALLKKYALFIADAKTPEAIVDEIIAIGVLTGYEAIAAQEAAKLRVRLNALYMQHNMRHSKERIRVFYLIWNEPIYTVGGSSLIDQAIQFCGAANIFSEMSVTSPVVSRESVIRAAPELMIFGASEENFDAWRNDWQRWTQIPAVQKQNVVRVDPDLLHRPGPRFIDGMEALCQTIAQVRVKMQAQKF